MRGVALAVSFLKHISIIELPVSCIILFFKMLNVFCMSLQQILYTYIPPYLSVYLLILSLFIHTDFNTNNDDLCYLYSSHSFHILNIL
jgi:hypothetical protein